MRHDVKTQFNWIHVSTWSDWLVFLRNSRSWILNKDSKDWSNTYIYVSDWADFFIKGLFYKTIRVSLTHLQNFNMENEHDIFSNFFIIIYLHFLYFFGEFWRDLSSFLEIWFPKRKCSLHIWGPKNEFGAKSLKKKKNNGSF